MCKESCDICQSEKVDDGGKSLQIPESRPFEDVDVEARAFRR